MHLQFRVFKANNDLLHISSVVIRRRIHTRLLWAEFRDVRNTFRGREAKLVVANILHGCHVVHFMIDPDYLIFFKSFLCLV